MRGLPAALTLVLLAGFGCGYRLLGGSAPQAARVWLGPVADDSAEPLFGAHVRAALAREVVDRADVVLADRQGATASLTARVTSTKETTTAYVAGDNPRQYLLVAEAEATLSSNDGTVLWKGLNLRADRQFSAGDTVEGTQTNKQQALQLLAGDLSREIARRVSLSLSTLPELP